MVTPKNFIQTFGVAVNFDKVKFKKRIVSMNKMKAVKQCFSIEQLVILCKLAVTFEPIHEILKCDIIRKILAWVQRLCSEHN